MLVNSVRNLQNLADAKSGDPYLDQMKTPIVKDVVRKVLSDEGRITMRWEDEPTPEPEPTEPEPEPTPDDDSEPGA
jgi:hypothetical protein